MLSVVAAIIEINNKILIAKRKFHKRYGGCWEFPGGKIENSETPQNALKRELFEELGITAKIGKFIGSSLILDSKHEPEISLDAYMINQYQGSIILNDHSEIKWIEPVELINYNFTPADIPIIKLLLNSCLVSVK